MNKLKINDLNVLEFQEFFDSKKIIPEYINYNWLGCSEVCENKARQYAAIGDKKTAKHWQNLAIDLMLHIQSLDTENYFSTFARTQRLRAILIDLQLIDSKANTIREIGNDIEHFLELNNIDFESIQGMSWAEVGKKKLTQLRQIKNLMNVIESISDNSKLLQYPEIAMWYSRKSKLP
jgi:hypothetical protein